MVLTSEAMEAQMTGAYRVQAWDDKLQRYGDVSIIYDRFGPVDWELAGDQPATEFTDWEDAIREMNDLPGRAMYCCIDVKTQRRFFDDNDPPEACSQVLGR
jgi:hypothetical protein